MKIAYVNASVVPSTTANSMQVMKVCQSLVETAGEVCLWVPGHQSTPFYQLAAHYGLRTSFQVRWVTTYPIWRSYDFGLKSLRQAKAWGADLVYTRMLPVAVLALWMNLPVILELHLIPSGLSGPWLFRQFVHHSGKKRLLVITQALRQTLETQFGVTFNPGEVQVAPSGVDLERYANLPTPAEARRRLGYPEQPTAAYTGHFYAGRGTELLFGLAQHFPQVHFLWIGGKPADVESWRARLKAAGVSNVTLTGFVDNQILPQYQAAADILLMPYERIIGISSGGNTASICSPIKMFEYLASGRAILSSDLPVLREVLTPHNAVFCPPEDLPAWRQALSALLADPQRMQQLGRQARQDAEQYSWTARSARTLEGFKHDAD